MQDGLYKINANLYSKSITSYSKTSALSSSNHKTLCKLWHYRLGYISKAKLSHVDIPSIDINEDHYACEVFPLAKQQILKFS